MIVIKVHLHFLDILGDNLRAFCPLFFNCSAPAPILLYQYESIHTYQSPNCDAYFQIYFWKQVFD